MIPHNNTVCCLWVALFVVASVVSAHKAPFEDSEVGEDVPEVDGVERDLDNTWLLDQSFLIFCMYPKNNNQNLSLTLFEVMQAGFGMLESGMVRAKNAKNVILKVCLLFFTPYYILPLFC
jgi:hypothetical protein